MGILEYLLQCDMLLHAKSVSIREKTFFTPKHHFFAKKLAGFGIFAYLCPRYKDSGRPLGRAHVRRSALTAGHFFMPIGCLRIPLRLPFRKKTIALWVSHYLCSTGCAAVSLSLRQCGSLAGYKDSAICNS